MKMSKFNPRNPFVLDLEAADALILMGEGRHTAWILRKAKPDWQDLLDLNLKDHMAQVEYVEDSNDVLYAWVNTRNPATAREIMDEFPGYSFKVASSPCDRCKLWEKGFVKKANYPVRLQNEDELWLESKLDEFLDPLDDDEVEYLGTRYPSF